MLVVLAGVLPVSSCWFGRAKALPPPVPPPVQLPANATPPQRIDEPPEIIPPALPAPSPPIEFPAPEPKAEPQEEPNRPRRRVSPPPTVQPEPPPPAPAPKVPQLAPLIGEQERREHDAAIDGLISRTVRNLGQARSRTLTAEQRNMVERAEAFLAQARDLRKVDPVAAKSLAERAELLSRHASDQ